MGLIFRRTRPLSKRLLAISPRLSQTTFAGILKVPVLSIARTMEPLDYSYEKLQGIFVQTLKAQYEKVYGFYNDMFARCVMDSYKKKYKCLMVLQSLLHNFDPLM